MVAIPRSDGALLDGGKDDIEVLITGFGPFAAYKENPSWLAVRALHNTFLDTAHMPSIVPLTSLPSTTPVVDPATQNGAESSGRWIRIQAVQIPVEYGAVLDAIPRIHNNAVCAAIHRDAPSRNDPEPTEKERAADEQQRKTKGAPAQPWLDPEGDRTGFAGDGRSFPAGYAHSDHCGIDKRKECGGGYDIVVHVGVGKEGVVQVETQARASGYRIQARRPGFAPLVDSGAYMVAGPVADERTTKPMTHAQKMELERMAAGTAPTPNHSEALSTSGAINGSAQTRTVPFAAVPKPANVLDPSGLKRGLPASAYPQHRSHYGEGDWGGILFDELERTMVDVETLMTHMRKILPRFDERELEGWRRVRNLKKLVADNEKIRMGEAQAGKALAGVKQVHELEAEAKTLAEIEASAERRALSSLSVGRQNNGAPPHSPLSTATAAAALALGPDVPADNLGTRVPLGTSSDAGLFVCEYIYYASLAESKRAHARAQAGLQQQQGGGWRRKRTKVVFLHCPPVGKTLLTADVTEIIRQLVWALATGKDEREGEA